MHKERKEQLEELLCGSHGDTAVRVLQNGATVNLTVEGERFHFVVENKRGRVGTKHKKAADFSIELSDAALSCLLELNSKPENGIAELAIEIVSGILSKDPQRRIDLKIHAGPLELWQRGYISLAFVGGKPLLAFLANHGLANARQILAVLKNMRSS